MGESTGLTSDLRQIVGEEPLLAAALGAALIALATTPIAFAVLGRMGWFQARRGRTIQRPEFASIVASMLLVMGIPAIFALLALKSRHYDESRYEFDPNRTISVLDQGRQYASLKEADEAVRAERKRLDEARQSLVNSVKQLDESMLSLRAAAMQHPATYQALPEVLDRLASVHKQIGLDAPQQLMDEMAPPADLPQIPIYAMAPAGMSVMASGSNPALAPPSGAAALGGGISTATLEVELASVPQPQRDLATLLPLTDLPAGWAVGEMGGKHIETFNAENLYEKIDGRAESFIQFDVVGMAYTYFHPKGDDSSEAQLYIFQMANSLKAFGKFSSEKPPEVESVAVGDAGYVSAGSVFFHSGPYYAQIVLNTEDEALAKFAMGIAREVAARMRPEASKGAELAENGTRAPSEAGRVEPTPAAATSSAASPATPAQLFSLLPAGPNRTGETYAAQDVFGYAFLSDVFLADYTAGGDLYWQGFLRPYPNRERAAESFEQYLAAVQEYGGEVEVIDVDEADKMAICSLYGLYDAVFLKGNALAGGNGATGREPVEDFSRSFAASLPTVIPTIETDEPASVPGQSSGGDY